MINYRAPSSFDPSKILVRESTSYLCFVRLIHPLSAHRLDPVQGKQSPGQKPSRGRVLASSRGSSFGLGKVEKVERDV